MANKHIEVTRAFDFAPDGIEVLRIETGVKTVGKRCDGDQVSERCAEVALENDWAKKAKAPARTKEPQSGGDGDADQNGQAGSGNGEGGSSDEEGAEDS